MPEVLRESQARILSYSGGKMGISAVPGSGKTWTLSRLAAKLISTAELQPDQEVLVELSPTQRRITFLPASGSSCANPECFLGWVITCARCMA